MEDLDLFVVASLLLLKNEVTKSNALAAVAILAMCGTGDNPGNPNGTLGELLTGVLPKIEQPLLVAPTFLRLPQLPPLPDV